MKVVFIYKRGLGYKDSVILVCREDERWWFKVIIPGKVFKDFFIFLEYLVLEATCLLFMVSMAGFQFSAGYWFSKFLKCTKEGHRLCSPNEVISVTLTDKVI